MRAHVARNVNNALNYDYVFNYLQSSEQVQGREKKFSYEIFYIF